MRLFDAHRGRYGSPRITADLHEAAWRLSKNTLAKIKAEQRLVASRRRGAAAAPARVRGRWRDQDLIGRRFAAAHVNRKWYGDGTDIVRDEGKLFLDSVLDMAARRVVGYAVGEHHDEELAYAGLPMAVEARGVRDVIAGVILHTDQGSEYTAGLARAACDWLSLLPGSPAGPAGVHQPIVGPAAPGGITPPRRVTAPRYGPCAARVGPGRGATGR